LSSGGFPAKARYTSVEINLDLVSDRLILVVCNVVKKTHAFYLPFSFSCWQVEIDIIYEACFRNSVMTSLDRFYGILFRYVAHHYIIQVTVKWEENILP
jgi:hypothetical protein